MSDTSKDDGLPLRSDFSSEDQINELTSEFWEVQAKFDKLGDFGFKVKAFSLTLTSAILIATAANKINGAVALIALLGLGAFYLLEQYQASWKSAFGARSKVITDQVRRLKMKRSPSEMKRIRKALTSDSPEDLLHSVELKRLELSKKTWDWYFLKINIGRWILRANGLFYLSQLLMVITVVLLLTSGSGEKQEPALRILVKDGVFATGKEIVVHPDLLDATADSVDSGTGQQEVSDSHSSDAIKGHPQKPDNSVTNENQIKLDSEEMAVPADLLGAIVGSKDSGTGQEAKVSGSPPSDKTKVPTKKPDENVANKEPPKLEGKGGESE